MKTGLGLISCRKGKVEGEPEQRGPSNLLCGLCSLGLSDPRGPGLTQLGQGLAAGHEVWLGCSMQVFL